jgi:hypothetical protein
MIQGVNEQGTTEWKEERFGMIGGTALKDLMADKKVTDIPLFYKLLGEKSETFVNEHSFINDAMQRGLDLEPVAIQEAEKVLNLEFKSFGWCTREEFPINGCSPDGFTEDLKTAIEIKCPSSSTHAEYCFKNELPKVYFWQCINYFLINTELETLHFVSYRPENYHNPLFVKTITRDEIIPFKIGRKALSITVNEWVQLVEAKSNDLLASINEVLPISF